MGYMCHHAIVVTSCFEDFIKKAHEKAKEIFGNPSVYQPVSEIIKAEWNHYYSFFVQPDGSKEGWEESDIGDKNRSQFIGWMNALNTAGAGIFIEYAEVQYGDGNDDNKLLRHSKRLDFDEDFDEIGQQENKVEAPNSEIEFKSKQKILHSMLMCIGNLVCTAEGKEGKIVGVINIHQPYFCVLVDGKIEIWAHDRLGVARKG